MPKQLKAFKAAIKPAWQAVMDLLPARQHVMLEYLRVHRKLPNLDNPQTFNEKVCARMLFDRDPRLTDMVDKVKVKDIIAKKYGEKYIIPTLAVYNSAEEMDFTKAPLNKPPYVLKTNHASATNLYVKPDDGSFDPEAIRKKMTEFLKIDHAAIGEEWAYVNVDRKIFVEPYIETPTGSLADYKFHVFSGRMFAVETILDRYGPRRENCYDRDWNMLNVVVGNYPRYETPIAPPVRFKEMVELAEAIGSEFSYVRVDLYDIEGEIKFGEVTFYPGAGRDEFYPKEWDLKFGAQWKNHWNTQVS